MIYGIDITPFMKARHKFDTFRQNLITEQDKAGAVQAFEYCFELSWKTLKRLLNKKGIDVKSPRDCFREAALNRMISDPKEWFVFLDKRNLTSHTYNEDALNDVIKIFDDFSKALSEIVDFIDKEHAKEAFF